MNMVLPILSVACCCSAQTDSIRPDADIFQRHEAIVGVGSSHTIAIDLNADDLPDIVTANPLYDHITIVLALGDGNYADPLILDVGEEPSQVAAIDLNLDKILDLIVCNPESSDTSIFLGNGDGTFEPELRCDPGGSPMSMAFTDFNNDDYPDIVAASDSGHRFHVALNDGEGCFEPLAWYHVDGNVLTSCELVDIDLDGKLDVVTLSPSQDRLSVVRGLGGGVFDEFESYVIPDSPLTFAVCDLNNDDYPDLAIGTVGGRTVDLMLNQGDGTYQLSQQLECNGQVRSIAVYPSEGDETIDLLVACRVEDYLYRFTSNEQGVFGDPLIYETDERPRWVDVTDLNADGMLDVFVTNYGSGTVTILYGEEDGRLQGHRRYAVGEEPMGLALADLNYDSVVDLAVANRDGGYISLLFGIGDGTFGPEQQLDTDHGPRCVEVSDLNNDGVLDLIVRASDVSYLLGMGDGLFHPEVCVDFGSPVNCVTVEDLDRDGFPDLAVAIQDDELRVAYGSESGFGDIETYSTGVNPTKIAAGDLNEDGIPDLVVANRLSSDVSVFFGQNPSGFADEVRIKTGFRPISIEIADMNGDGALDLVTTNAISEDTSVIFGNGMGDFGPPLSVPSLSSPFHAGVIDLNLDGNLDILTVGRNDAASTVSVAFGSGGGEFHATNLFLFGHFPWFVRLSDVNGDGIADAVMSNHNTHDVLVLLNISEVMCPHDIGPRDGTVDLDDLSQLIRGYGMNAPGAAIAEPLDVVDVHDLLGMLGNWGPCR